MNFEPTLDELHEFHRSSTYSVIQGLLKGEATPNGVRFISSILLFAASLALPAFAAKPQSPTMTLSDVAMRLSKATKRDVKWEAPYGVTLRSDSEVSPMTVDEFVDFIEAMSKRAKEEHPEWYPLIVCIHPNALVVRTASQPKCGKPLIDAGY